MLPIKYHGFPEMNIDSKISTSQILGGFLGSVHVPSHCDFSFYTVERRAETVKL